MWIRCQVEAQIKCYAKEILDFELFLKLLNKPVEMQRGGEGHVASVSQRSDDQSSRVAKVFVAVLELCVGLAHHTVIIVL